MEPKFSLGEEVWSFDFDGTIYVPVLLKILGVNIYYGDDYSEITYKLDDEYNDFYSEEYLFHTKEEAQNHCDRVNATEI